MIEVIKASAGSGKTFTLAKKYIKLLLETQDRYAYRHILAVTFTNKATEEMKSRILKELYILATQPQKSDYYKEFVPAHYKDDASIMEAARTVLCNILHDYGAFAVSTIDHFFQLTLKAFSREIGHFASYQVELDRDSMIAESVDRVLDSLTSEQKDQKKLKWLIDNTITMLENGGKYRQDCALNSVALRLKSEEHRVLLEKEGIDESIIYSDDQLKKLSDGCKVVCDRFVILLRDAARKVWDEFTIADIDPYHTYKSIIANWLDKYRNLNPGDEVPEPSKPFLDRCRDVDQWFSKSKAHLADRVTADLLSAIGDFLDLFEQEYRVYNTANILVGQVYGFGIAIELHNEFEALMKEKNVLCLDDSNTILKNIIDGTDTPFIYEKLGVRYEHFLLDEFQDTSRVQWDNFRPLLKNSVDGGFYNLIVGDVKQSIYRFRDSDWKLLRDEVSGEFGKNVRQDTLKDNWRSFGNIIRFNNAFFEKMAEALDKKYDGSATGEICGIYEDVAQNVKKKGEGCVKLTFCPQENELDAILDSINLALSKGYSYKDIAVLVRWNAEGSAIAEHLIRNKVRVVTDDSLLVSSSLTVRRLVSLLSSIDNPDDTLAKYLATHLDIVIPQSYSSLVDLCEDLLRKLNTYNPEVFEAEVLYIQSFMDILRDHVQLHGNSLHAFLKEWEETKASKANINSPKVGDAVRIMTMHKSKGLDFRYVIVPYVESIPLFQHGKKWCKPEVKGTPLEGVAEGIYDVSLSSKSEDTLFAKHFKDETLLQYVDNVNVLYVALTRARECMDVISAMPEDRRGVLEGLGEIKDCDTSVFDNCADILCWYAYTYGKDLGMVPVESTPTDEEDSAGYEKMIFTYGDVTKAEQKEEEQTASFPASFCSWPLNPQEGLEDAPVNERGRLKFSSDSTDFFSEDGAAGVDASQRIKGIVLHDILAKVCLPEDLDAAVDAAVLAGTLPHDDVQSVKDLLRSRICSVEAQRWFPSERSCILNEIELIDTDGSIYRPDRVVRNGNKVLIVDYKFGDHYPKYERQLKRYAELWKRMGYDVVSANLWYVFTGEIVDVL